jgi:nucleotide-binding universal stress UspA family protein
MYRHLLVPVDDTDLSISVVGNAVALACSVGARVTFFHAVADDASSLRGEADVLRLTAPDEYEYASHGKAQELLAKAEAAARALGVPCESRQVVSDKPAQAIVDAAREGGCDLIFMASHGRHGKLGMALVSEMLEVLMNARLPVLISSIGEPAVPARAIGIIRDEHRSLAAVMHAWMHALAAARRAGSGADPALMRAIVRYVRQFPVELHHPKEEAAPVSPPARAHLSCDAELDELERQHQRDHELVAALERQVEALAPPKAPPGAGHARARRRGDRLRTRSCGTTSVARKASSCLRRSASCSPRTGRRSTRPSLPIGTPTSTAVPTANTASCSRASSTWHRPEAESLWLGGANRWSVGCREVT